MKRREALTATSLLLGGTLIGTTWLAGCAPESQSSTAGNPLLSPEDILLLDVLADALLPETQTASGAASTRIGAYIQLMLTDCYEPAQQQIVVNGLADFRKSCKSTYGKAFANLTREEKESFLVSLDRQARTKEDHYFGIIKSLTERGFFTSETGMTQALRWIPVPGRWEGCVPLKPGQPAWG